MRVRASWAPDCGMQTRGAWPDENANCREQLLILLHIDHLLSRFASGRIIRLEILRPVTLTVAKKAVLRPLPGCKRSQSMRLVVLARVFGVLLRIAAYSPTRAYRYA